MLSIRISSAGGDMPDQASEKYCPENRSPPDRFSEAICLENFLDPQYRFDIKHFFPTYQCALDTK